MGYELDKHEDKYIHVPKILGLAVEGLFLAWVSVAMLDALVSVAMLDALSNYRDMNANPPVWIFWGIILGVIYLWANMIFRYTKMYIED